MCCRLYGWSSLYSHLCVCDHHHHHHHHHHHRSLLTQGKIDGEGGRGSYAGLGDTLLTLVTRIGHRHSETFRSCEQMFALLSDDSNISSDTSTSPSLSFKLLSGNDDDNSVEGDKYTDTESVPSSSSSSSGDNDNNAVTMTSLPYEVDLLVSGVYVPVLNLLSEKFPGMFSVGIATTFATCYFSVKAFATALCNLLQTSSSSSSWSTAERQQVMLHHRLLSHPVTHAFSTQWRFPLYLQVHR